MNSRFWEVLDIPMKYINKPYIIVDKSIDSKMRIVLPNEAKKFYNNKCKITMETDKGIIVITPLK